MNFFAPERNRIQDWPCYLKFSAVLPYIAVAPDEDGGFAVVVDLPSSDRDHAFGQHYGSFTPDAFIAFMQEYRDDPEETLKRYFDWSGEAPGRKQKLTLTLEDLGL